MNPDLILRLKVATETGYLPRDLGDELLAGLPRIMSFNTRKAVRDHCIRQAGALIPGSVGEKARTLKTLIDRLHRPTDQIRALLYHGSQYAPLPGTSRHLIRILEKSPL